MVRAIQKRFFKRCLELIGAVAVVYLMLEVLENQTSNNHNNNRLMVRVELVNRQIEPNIVKQ